MKVTKDRALMLVRDLLVSEFGEALRTGDGDQVVLRRDGIREYQNAWLVPVDTLAHLSGGPSESGVVPSAAVVPKDPKVPSHYAPTALTVEDYLDEVEAGERPWNSAPPDRVTYYAKTSVNAPRSRPKGLLRRRLHQGRLFDERFVASLRWEPTEFFELQRIGRDDDDFVEITKEEADAFIDRVRAHVQAS